MANEDQVAAGAAGMHLAGNQWNVPHGDGVFLVPLHRRGHIQERQRESGKHSEVMRLAGTVHIRTNQAIASSTDRTGQEDGHDLEHAQSPTVQLIEGPHSN
ncbi:hypothetical protein D9M70_529860 [compost metagenome]